MSAKKRDLLFALVIPVTLILSIHMGRYPVPVSQIFSALWQAIAGQDVGVLPEHFTIITKIRLPRSLMAMIVGASLAASGTAYQGIFRNPLVSASMLGVSSGASLGAAIAILLFANTFYTPVFAFTFGVFAVWLSYLVGKVRGSTTTITLVLGGVIISNIFSALLSFVKYIADPANRLPSITYWSMGSLASVSSATIRLATPPMAAGLLILWFSGWNINLLSMGDDEAQTLGLHVNTARALIIAGATMATAGAVCACGTIGWVGLVIPHVARMFVGNDNRRLMPVSMFMGAGFLMLIDVLCRTISGAEIPLGIMTSIIGGPFFIYLVKKKKGWGWA